MRTCCVAAVCGVLGFAATAQAAEWPQWRGPGRDGHVPAGERVPASLPASVNVLWKIPVGESFASPVVAGGKLFHLDRQGDKEVVHALDAATGRELWQQELDGAFRDGFGQGPRCTPLVDGDRVYVQSCKGELRCLNVADGATRWRANFADFGAVFIGEKGSAAGAQRHGNTGAPILDGDHLIAGVGSPKGAAFVCFDKLTGKVIWQSQDDQTGNAAPIFATIGGQRQLVAYVASGLLALDPADGKALWRVGVTTRLGRHVTTPVAAEDTVVVGSFQFGLVGAKVTRDGEAWKAERAWVDKGLAVNFSSPVVVGKHLYAVGQKKNVFCAEVATGKQAWSQPGLISGGGDSGYGSFIVMGPNILLLCDTGELVLFAAEPGAFRLVGRVQACGQTWCSPAYAEGKLYVRDKKEMMGVSLAP